jgi:NADP-dependent 3-hydroxy acid dehydrogenase YdfG
MQLPNLFHVFVKSARSSPPTAGTVLVTDASRGVGRSTAELFHAGGWNVVAVIPTMSRSSTGPDASERLLVTSFDPTRAVSSELMVSAGIDRFGKIDVLVNMPDFDNDESRGATDPDHDRIEKEASSRLAAINAVLAHFRARRAGCLVDVSVLDDRQGGSQDAVGDSTDATIREALQSDMRTSNVTMKSVAVARKQLAEPSAIARAIFEALTTDGDRRRS